ncbi:MAG: twin-arginine translocase subunit TatC [Bacteroidota bacterium]
MALDQQHDEEKEMSFLDHLEELRWHIVRAIAACAVGFVFAFGFAKWIFDNIVFAPAKPSFITFRVLCKIGEYLGRDMCVTSIPFKVQSRFVTGQFSMQFTAAAVIGLIIAFPYVFWELWRFIKPGLYSKERKGSQGAVAAVTLLFLSGVSFGYFILCPMSMYFFANYTISDMIVNEFDITSYVSTIVALVFGSGVLFQLPVAIFFLTRIGLVNPPFLRTYRKHAIIVILILAAIITPPDVISQIIITVPLIILYEISIFISAREVRRKQRIEALEQ